MSSHTLHDTASATPDDMRDRPGRRGPHSLVTLAAFVGLIAGFMGVVVVLLTLARLVQGAL
jgi:hypothetical protein